MPTHSDTTPPERHRHHGDVVREAIASNGYSITDAAAELGISRSRLTAILRGNGRISESLAWSLNDVFGRGEDYWYDLQSSFHPSSVPNPVQVPPRRQKSGRLLYWVLLIGAFLVICSGPLVLFCAMALGFTVWALILVARCWPRTSAAIPALLALFWFSRRRHPRPTGSALEHRGEW